MHHRRAAEPVSARPRVASPPLYRGHAARLDAPSTAIPFDWRALGVLLLVIAIAWLAAVASTDLNALGTGEPDATAQVGR